MIDRPNFKFSRRGYEPEEVDAFIESQNRTLQAAKKDAAERSVELTKLNAALTDLRGQLGQQSRVMADLKKQNTPPRRLQTFADLGERIGQILTLADTRGRRDAQPRRRGGRRDPRARQPRRRRAQGDDERLRGAGPARADEESVRIIAQANREAQAIIAEAQSVTATQRQEAAAEYETHRAAAAAATAELETTLAARRETGRHRVRAPSPAAGGRARRGRPARLRSSPSGPSATLPRCAREAERTSTTPRRRPTRSSPRPATTPRACARSPTASSRPPPRSATASPRSSANVRQMLATLGGGACRRARQQPRPRPSPRRPGAARRPNRSRAGRPQAREARRAADRPRRTPARAAEAGRRRASRDGSDAAPLREVDGSRSWLRARPPAGRRRHVARPAHHRSRRPLAPGR